MRLPLLFRPVPQSMLCMPLALNRGPLTVEVSRHTSPSKTQIVVTRERQNFVPLCVLRELCGSPLPFSECWFLNHKGHKEIRSRKREESEIAWVVGSYPGRKLAIGTGVHCTAHPWSCHSKSPTSPDVLPRCHSFATCCACVMDSTPRGMHLKSSGFSTGILKNSTVPSSIGAPVFSRSLMVSRGLTRDPS